MQPIPERFFYHSFPRRDRNTTAEIDRACKVLALIRDVGLLLAPEVVKWQYSHADGSPPRKQEVLQKRLCFTELSPSELARHAESFGRFALEFRIDTLKSLGAIPVFYVPQATREEGEPIELGSTLVMQLVDAMVLAMRLAGVKNNVDAIPEATAGDIDCTFGFEKLRTFRFNVTELRRTLEGFTYALTPPDMLEHSLAGLLNMFYPADDVHRNDPLAYYRQREWRVVSNFAIRGEEVMRLPSVELIDRLLQIDAAFWGREFRKGSGSDKRLADEVWVYPGIRGKRMIEMVNRVIVPADAMERAADVLKGLSPCPPVVPLESIAT